MMSINCKKNQPEVGAAEDKSGSGGVSGSRSGKGTGGLEGSAANRSLKISRSTPLGRVKLPFEADLNT